MKKNQLKQTFKFRLYKEDKDKIDKAKDILSIPRSAFIRMSAVKLANETLQNNGGLSD